LEYDVVLAPGANVNKVRFLVAGANKLALDKSGNLLLSKQNRTLQFLKPLAYQIIDGKKHFLDVHYILSKQQIAFAVASYDKTKSLIIDPRVSYATILGGDGNNESFGIAVDIAGSAYVTGVTTSTNFPTRVAQQSTINGKEDAFVAKLSSTGKNLDYSTYLGGSGTDEGRGIAVDPSGNAYVTGSTNSLNFPTKNPLPPNGKGFDGGKLNAEETNPHLNFVAKAPDAFVVRINPVGNLNFSTYLGGTSGDVGRGIAVDPSGNTYVTGLTLSTDFPTTSNALQQTAPQRSRLSSLLPTAFVSKINTVNSTVVYSTYFGGEASDVGNGIAVDSGNNIYITGTTSSSGFPRNFLSGNRLPQKLKEKFRGGLSAAFVSKINPSAKLKANALVYSIPLAGSKGDSLGTGIALDGGANAYVTGTTSSSDFPTTPGALQSKLGGGSDAFATKISSDGRILFYSTYLGGSGTDEGGGIAVDPAGNAYVTGTTASGNFPTLNPFPANGNFTGVTLIIRMKQSLSPSELVVNLVKNLLNKEKDSFVTELNPDGKTLVYSTLLGASKKDESRGIAVDPLGNAYVTGSIEIPPGSTLEEIKKFFNISPKEAFVIKVAP